MNFIRMIYHKPLSIGAILFFWLPLFLLILSVLYLGIKYWWVTLIIFILICMIAGTQEQNRQTAGQLEDAGIQSRLDGIRRLRTTLLWRIGRAENNGNYSVRQKLILDQIEDLNRQEKEFRETIEVGEYGYIYKGRKR